MIADVRAILAFMYKSTYTAEHFDEARKKLKISHGLTRIGETCFSTYVSTVESIKRCLPAFELITRDRRLAIDITVSLISTVTSMRSSNLLFASVQEQSI